MAVERWVVLLAASSWISCSGGPESETVPLDVERIELTATCVGVEAGDRVVSVGPEGQLWLARENGAGRIIDVDGSFSESLLGFDEVTTGQAWDETTLSLVEAGELWTQTGESREHIPLPEEVGAAETFCGDPSRDRATFVAGSAGLFERAIGFWWQWSPSESDSFGAIRQLARVDGACTDDRDALWVLNEDGQLWQVAVDDAKLVGGEDAPIDQVAIARTIGVGTVSEGALAIGPSPWIDVDFEAGDVTALSAGGDALWAIAGGISYVRSADGWRHIDTGDATEPSAVHAHAAGGAWLEYAGQSLCHVAVAAPVRITGVRPFEHRLLSTANLDVSTAESEVTLSLDGEQVGAAIADEGLARFFEVDLGGAGWHTLEVAGGERSRELDYFVVDIPEVSWQTEIAPLFSQYCAGALCHGPSPEGARVDLSSYESWQARAPLIRTRLVRGEMPPVDPKPPGDSVELVLDWIEGGMKP